MAVEVTIRKILHRWTGAVLWEGEATSIRDAAERAVASRADLGDADLRGADLGDADLRGANLSDADLSGANLGDAYLGGANLRGANLSDADLSGANLSGANLRGADLGGANLGGAKHVRLPTGETWDEYLTQTVPALLTAGGQSLASFAEHWQCHTWDNCPIAHAFSGHGIEDVPILLRPRAEQFVQLFDARQIPWPLPSQGVLKEDDAAR